MKSRTYYDILGLNHNADQAEIRKAYKEQAKKFHPDKISQTGKTKEEAEEAFKAVSNAYQILSDEIERKAYDSTFRTHAPSPSHSYFSAASPSFKFVFENDFDMFFRFTVMTMNMGYFYPETLETSERSLNYGSMFSRIFTSDRLGGKVQVRVSSVSSSWRYIPMTKVALEHSGALFFMLDTNDKPYFEKIRETVTAMFQEYPQTKELIAGVIFINKENSNESSEMLAQEDMSSFIRMLGVRRNQVFYVKDNQKDVVNAFETFVENFYYNQFNSEQDDTPALEEKMSASRSNANIIPSDFLDLLNTQFFINKGDLFWEKHPKVIEEMKRIANDDSKLDEEKIEQIAKLAHNETSSDFSSMLSRLFQPSIDQDTIHFCKQLARLQNFDYHQMEDVYIKLVELKSDKLSRKLSAITQTT